MKYALNTIYIHLFTELLLFCIPFNLIGVYYIIFVLKEPKINESAVEPAGVDNRAFENAPNENIQQTQITTDHPLSLEATDKKKTNFLVDFFDPTVAIQCTQIIIRKREKRGRVLIIFMFFMYFIAIGPAMGEGPNEYNFTRTKLNWGSIEYSHFLTYTSALGFISTTIMITVFKKWLKLPDASIGIVSCVLGCVARILFVNIL